MTVVLALVSCQEDPETQAEDDNPPAEVDEPAVAPEETVVAEFDGEGDETTDAFDIEEGWEIRWETQAEAFQIELFTEGDHSQGVVVEHEGSGGGSAFPATSGTQYLQISGEGPWSVRIIEGMQQ